MQRLWVVKRHGLWKKARLEHVREEIMEGMLDLCTAAMLISSHHLDVSNSNLRAFFIICLSVCINGRFITLLYGL